jgi:O-methyltransferase domain
MSGEAGLKLAYDDKWIEFLANHPTATVEFQAAMSERTAAFAPSVAATYDFSRMRRVVDVGGGRGTLLAAILAARTHLHGVVFDLPGVVAGAPETFRAAGVAERCAIDSGDFFVAVPARLGRRALRGDPAQLPPGDAGGRQSPHCREDDFR